MKRPRTWHLEEVNVVRRQRPFALSILLASTIALTGCAVRPWVVNEPAPAKSQASTTLQAGTAEVDITPGMGAPLFGYSWDAAKKARGVWTRLKARVIALQDSNGERLALVQADLGAVSGLVHRRVAERSAPLDGITADRLLIAATHTHAGPGGYFGEPFFNVFGAGRPGYDPEIAELLVTRISEAIHRAFSELGPAALGATDIDVPNVARNRSCQARLLEHSEACTQGSNSDVDAKLRMLRIDRTEPGFSSPLAALCVFAVHGTALPHSNQLYHGDLHGVAARALAARIAKARPGHRPLLAAFMNGAEGDVSPTSRTRGESAAIELGEAIAQQAYQAYVALDGQLDANPTLLHSYREIELPDTKTTSGAVCSTAEIGVPSLGGAEDGRSPLYGRFGVYEGRRREVAVGCQGFKVPAAGLAQDWLLLQPDDPSGSNYQTVTGQGERGAFPRIAPFQVFSLGNAMVIATVPGEPTTEVGARIRAAVSTHLVQATASQPRPIVAVVGLANEYFYYFTTPGEYDAQHYEGGSTIYGPHAAVAVVEQLEAAAIALGQSNAQSYSTHREFYPGHATSLAATGRCLMQNWRILDTKVIRPGAGGQGYVTISVKGPSEGQQCGRQAAARIVCGAKPLVGPDGMAEDDDGYRFQLQRINGDTWNWTWRMPKNLQGVTDCAMEISRQGQSSLVSKSFNL